MPTKRCCFCGNPSCVGCCFPWEDYDFGPLGTGRRVKIVSWEISAPNCAILDGLTGQLSPETTGPHSTFGGCGNCLCMVNTTHDIPSITGTAYFDNLGVCSNTPCGITFCFNVFCDKNAPENEHPEAAPCCERIKLLILTWGGKVIGGEEVDILGNECLLDLEGDDYVSFFGCDGEGAQALLQLSPIACECDPDEPLNFVVVYDLSELSFDCSELFPLGHPCEGLPVECCPNACSLAGATLTLTLGE